MAEFSTRKGFNIRLSGPPSDELKIVEGSEETAIYPREFAGIKPRLLVKEGESVKRGTPLFLDKKCPELRFTSPAAGKVRTVEYGPRRAIEKIVVDVARSQRNETFPVFEPASLRTAARDRILEVLTTSGYLAYLVERPFSRIANPAVSPKSIFVNAMDSAPFHTDISVAISGNETAFQAGLQALGRLTDGLVHLVLPGDRNDLPRALTGAEGVEIHRASGPHPAGNTSFHIHSIDPIVPGDVVWTIRADDLIQIGRLLLDGKLPADRVVALGGPGVGNGGGCHYRVPNGAPLHHLLNGNLSEGEKRVINGDVMGGTQIAQDGHLPFRCSGLTVIAEDSSRHFMAWAGPGLGRFSTSRAYLSWWLARGKTWDLGSSQNGSLRAMVLTGLYDKYMPMNIMVDYLIRAVIANDTDEAIQLGILETDPEDFAGCAFACPSKMDLVGIVRKGLDMIEEEGI
jgi:Na+-transporting NADH:ubiquinone oxidoreductase subunit A